MNQDIKVSVCMITYGHEKFIRQAIEGVLMQECNFEIELIIANDCSPDRTEEIINDLLEDHPNRSWIKYFNHDQNIGIMENSFFALSKCSGKYIAMCEGDDYWITKDKLRKQVKILEENEEVGLVYSDVKYFIQETEQLIDVPSRFVLDQEEVIPQMLKSKFVEFASTVFRKRTLEKALEKIMIDLENKVIGDTRLILETIYISKLYFLNEVTTVYRILNGSASRQIEVDKRIFVLLDTYHCRKSFVTRNKLDTKWLSDSICNTNRGLINNAFVANNYRDIFLCLKELLIFDTIRYCSWNVFKKKITWIICTKLFLSVLGLGIFRQNLKK